MKNQYFQPRTLPQPSANFPEPSGSATELSGAAQKLSGGPSGGPAPARAGGGGPRPAHKNHISRNRARELTKFLLGRTIQVLKKIVENINLLQRFEKIFF